MPGTASCMRAARARRHMSLRRVSGACVLLVASVSWADERPMDVLASDILRSMPRGTSVAVRPFHLLEDSAKLPAELGRRLYSELVTALVRDSAASGVSLLTRRLGEVYGVHEDHYSDVDLATLLRNARANIEILCPVTSGRGAETVRISCEAVDLESGEMVSGAEAHVPLEWRDMFDFAFARLADRIVSGVPSAWALRGVRFVERSGCRSVLGDFAGPRLRAQVNDLLRERAHTPARAVTGDGGAATEADAPPVYAVHGMIGRYDDRFVTLEVSLVDEGDFGSLPVVEAEGDVAVEPLPERFARYRCVEHTAEGRARVSEHLHEASARRAALNLARARVVAPALGTDAPAVDLVTGEEEAVAVMGSLLQRGLTVEEHVSEGRSPGSAADRVSVHLRAQVVPVGAVAPPAVRASLDRALYRARTEPIRIEITSDEQAYVAVFAWGADDVVVRLYPRAGASLEVDAGDTLSLPRAEDGHLLSEPLPGNDQDHEALIVVALREPADFEPLAPALTDVIAGDAQPPGAQRFIDALAGLDTTRMTIAMLPYRVLR